MDVGAWLRSLGLGQYEDVFRDSGVDAAVLPKLTADDLKELGVAGVGYRRKIISAIEELNASSVVSTDTAKPDSTPKSSTGQHRSRRRRAPSAHGHVLRSRRLDRAFRTARPRGYA